MKIIKTENKLCLICMEQHDVNTVLVEDEEEFKNQDVTFEACYEYCSRAEEYLETEEMIKANGLAMKDAYRDKVGLLTSKEIIEIRNMYDVSQKDFSEILGWGGATITRYENHQVQDQVHDDVLRKIDNDPQWFLQMLNRTKDELSEKAYKNYRKAAEQEFSNRRNDYLVKSIEAVYAEISGEHKTGGVELNLQKVVEVINYFASKVRSLHKVKLMKMLWYADALSFKRRDIAITGLAYCAWSLGAVPKAHEQILNLDGIEYEDVKYKVQNCESLDGFKFKVADGFSINVLSVEEIEILNDVIKEVGNLNADQIVKKMHEEEAYKETNHNAIISFAYADKLSID